MDSQHSGHSGYRNLWVVGILSGITGGLYNIYLAFRWAAEINELAGTKKVNPSVVLLVSALSLGLGVLVFECVFARDLESIAEDRGEVSLITGFSTVIIALNVSAVLLIMSGVGIILGLPLGIAATVLIQRQFNALIDPLASE